MKYVKIKIFVIQLCLLKTLKYLNLIKVKNLIKRHFFTYADLKCLVKKIDGCKNNPENSSATKVDKHILSSFPRLQYHHLKAQKEIMMYRKVKIA